MSRSARRFILGLLAAAAVVVVVQTARAPLASSSRASTVSMEQRDGDVMQPGSAVTPKTTALPRHDVDLHVASGALVAIVALAVLWQLVVAIDGHGVAAGAIGLCWRRRGPPVLGVLLP